MILQKLPNELWIIILKFLDLETIERIGYYSILYRNKYPLKENILNTDIIRTCLLDRFILGNKLLQLFYNTWTKIDIYNTKYKLIMKYSEVYNICNSKSPGFQKHIITMIIRNLISRYKKYENNDRGEVGIKDSVLYKKHYRISHLFQYPTRYNGTLTRKEYKEGIDIGKKICDLIFVD